MVKLDTALNLEELSPGIKNAVQFLNMEGFQTIDSGDGSLAKEGMECAFEEPMVGIQVEPDFLITATHRLRSILLAEGVEARVEGSYSPDDETAVIVAFGTDLVNLGTQER